MAAHAGVWVSWQGFGLAGGVAQLLQAGGVAQPQAGGVAGALAFVKRSSMSSASASSASRLASSLAASRCSLAVTVALLVSALAFSVAACACRR